MGWNCQNTLGSSVSYRILRYSKCFTLSRFEKWVSWVPTGLFVFSALENRKMSRNGLKLSNTLGSSVSYRILRYSKYFTLSRYEKWVSWVPTGLFVFSAFENQKISRNVLKLSNTLGSSVSYRILRNSKRFTLSRYEKWVRVYLLVCSYSLHSKTKKFLEMCWNCQNTLGSSVPYRILRNSKRFTLSRYEKWVRVYLLVCSYSLHSKTKKFLEMCWNCQIR